MNLYQKLNAIMGEVESLQKDGKVAFNTTKYNYLSEAKTTAIFHEKLFKHKLVILPIEVNEEVKGSITQGRYKYKLVNCENPEEFEILESGGQGHDSADKGSGKASSYAYKYLLWRMFAIPSNDDPDQTSSDEIKSKQAIKQEEHDDEIEALKNSKVDKVQIATMQAEMLKKNVLEKTITDAYKVKALSDLTKEQFVSVMRRLETK